MSLAVLGFAVGHDSLGLVRLLLEPQGEWGVRWGTLGASDAREDFRLISDEVCDLVALWDRDTPITAVAFDPWNARNLAVGVARRVAANLVREVPGPGRREPRHIVDRYIATGALPSPASWSLYSDPLLQPALIAALRCAEQLVWAGEISP
jgi:hypothetical protein